MKKIFALCTIIAMVFAVNAQAAQQSGWGDTYTGMAIDVGHVTVDCASGYVSSFKKGNDTLGGPGAGPGGANTTSTSYTAPSWATASPSVFSIEQYSFPGATTATYIDHRTNVNNNAGPWPTPVSEAYLWVNCGAGVVYPPIPSMYGTSLDGGTLVLTLPYAGNWYITVGFSGFSAGTYDWGWMTDYTGLTPIPVPPAATTDLGGFEFGPGVTNILHNANDAIGNGAGSGRPWCFKI